MITNGSITKRYYIVNPTDQYADDIEVDYHFFNETHDNERYIVVNFVELLKEYNNYRTDDGIGPIKLSPNLCHSSNVSSAIFSADLAELADSISRIVRNCIDREDLLKVETLDSIIDEGLNSICGDTIKTSIPVLQRQLNRSMVEAALAPPNRARQAAPLRKDCDV